MAGYDQYMSCAVSYPVCRLAGQRLVYIYFPRLAGRIDFISINPKSSELSTSCQEPVLCRIGVTALPQLLSAFPPSVSLHTTFSQALSQEMAIASRNSFMPSHFPHPLSPLSFPFGAISPPSTHNTCLCLPGALASW